MMGYIIAMIIIYFIYSGYDGPPCKGDSHTFPYEMMMEHRCNQTFWKH